MKPLSIDFISNSINGEIVQGDLSQTIDGVSIDSRTIQKGQLFFAIIGERMDGRQFIANAVEKGATAIVVDRNVDVADSVAVIRVEDTSQALQDLAREYRCSIKGLTVVAITGSAGKTSTKDMIAALLKLKYKTKKTQGNLNNYYGLPLTILRLDGDEEVAVLEMGMSNLGEIELLSSIAEPDIGVITNVGEAHLESLGSIENVARGKSELISSLPNNGIAVLNFDNKYVRDMKQVFRGKEIVYYGFSSESDIYADDIINKNSGTQFTVHYQNDDINIKINRPGQHNIYNALAAIAVARSMDLSWADIKRGFSLVEYSALRWDLKENSDGVEIINDAYNANPLSMKAVIEAISSMEGERHILALGSMLELGDEERRAHLELGKYIEGKPIDFLLTVGRTAALIADGAEKAGVDSRKIKRVDNNQEAVEFLKDYLKTDDIILVKGSRGNRMEEIVEGLLES
ncbi:MAG: UDP-N-acetylmuramoyl-tripeptide--D-alanyl-D-alanine ligase [Halanaerobiales bacterium]